MEATRRWQHTPDGVSRRTPLARGMVRGSALASSALACSEPIGVVDLHLIVECEVGLGGVAPARAADEVVAGVPRTLRRRLPVEGAEALVVRQGVNHVVGC